MKSFNFFYLLLLPLALFTACNKQDLSIECNSPSTDMILTRSNCLEYNAAVYQKSTNSWLVKRKDPYCLNFQKKVIGNNIKLKSLISSSSGLELLPTHYAIRLYPKDEREYETIIKIKDIDVAYFPFDYVPVQVDASVREDSLYLEEDTKYTIEKDIYDIDGNFERIDTEVMPVLYAVWPVAKPFPDNIDFKVDYEVLIPQKASNYSVNKDFFDLLERVSVFQATGISMPINANGPRNVYYITDYDEQLDENVPLAHLKVRFQIGSSIIDRITNSNGSFSYNYTNGTTVQAILQNDKWNITNTSSTNPITINITSLFTSGSNNIEIDNDICPVLRALDYYYYGNHEVVITNNSSLIRVKILSSSQYSGKSGEFHPGLLGPSAIDIYPGIFSDMELFAIVCHEMGHFNHYLRRGNFLNYTSVHRLFKESYASYSGWYLGHKYFRIYNTTTSDWWVDYYIGYSWQNWRKTDTGDSSHYSPLFVDLIDDFDQCYNNPLLNYDPISGANHQIIFAMIAPKNWSDIKAKLAEYIGSVITQTEYTSFIVPYDYYFANN